MLTWAAAESVCIPEGPAKEPGLRTVQERLGQITQGIVLALLAPSPLPRLHKLAVVLVDLALLDQPAEQSPPPLVAALQARITAALAQLRPGATALTCAAQRSLPSELNCGLAGLLRPGGPPSAFAHELCKELAGVPAAAALERGAVPAAVGRVKAKLRTFAEHHARTDVLAVSAM